MVTALPVRIPHTTGHSPSAVARPPRPAYAQLGLHACEIDPDSEDHVLCDPDRRRCAQRANSLLQVAPLIQIRKAAGL